MVFVGVPAEGFLGEESSKVKCMGSWILAAVICVCQAASIRAQETKSDPLPEQQPKPAEQIEAEPNAKSDATETKEDPEAKENAESKEDSKSKEDEEKNAKPKPFELAPDVPVRLIAFGSGIREDRAQPVWRTVMTKGPKLFIFVGDVITGNTTNEAMRQLKYTALKRRLDIDVMKSHMQVMATWDDLDYGLNDSGAEFEGKEASKKMFLEYFGEPADSPRWQHAGIYDAKVFGPPGKALQVILLDTRTFRSPLVKRKNLGFISDGHPGTYTANNDSASTILGSEQWQWLEEQLRQPADLRLIVSSFQVVAEEHGYESWMSFPHERQRLFELIRDTKATGVVFLSGDRNHAEISRVLDPIVGYPLYDITTGPLNGISKWQNEINRHRLGSILNESNFGAMSINWEEKNPEISVYILEVKQGDIKISTKFRLDSLRPEVSSESS